MRKAVWSELQLASRPWLFMALKVRLLVEEAKCSDPDATLSLKALFNAAG